MRSASRVVAGVVERMAIDLGEQKQTFVHHHADASVGIVDRGKAPNRIAEAQAPEPKTRGNELQFDARFVLGDHERHALIVLHVIGAMPSSSRLAKSLFRSPAMGAEITPVSTKCSFPRKFC